MRSSSSGNLVVRADVFVESWSPVSSCVNGARTGRGEGNVSKDFAKKASENGSDLHEATRLFTSPRLSVAPYKYLMLITPV